MTKIILLSFIKSSICISLHDDYVRIADKRYEDSENGNRRLEKGEAANHK